MTEYYICDGLGTLAVILPEKGATVISLQKNGQEFLYRDDEIPVLQAMLRQWNNNLFLICDWI